ncbi:MAG: hypothetical protein PHS06_01495 [Candidatus Shapirobacteria bacterium]|nr:hypothetical protein [Candidatus Shapirobacteria bacterium]
MTERTPLTIKGMNINDVVSQTFQNQAIERFNRNRNLYNQNKETTDGLIDKLKLNINHETKFTIFEKPKNPHQPETQINITNIKITDTSIVFSRSDNPEKRISMNYMSFCILTKLTIRNQNGLLEKNLTLTAPKLDQTR